MYTYQYLMLAFIQAGNAT